MNVARIDGSVISSDEFVSWLKLSGRFSHIAGDLIKERLSAHAARKQGLEVSGDELQRAADDHRRAMGLHRVKDANEFLESASASLEDYEAFIEGSVLARKLKDHVSDSSAVQAYFKLNAPHYEAVELGHIVVDSEDKAREIQLMLAEDPDSFAELAREQSEAESAKDGGRIGRVFRGALNAELEAKLFTAGSGEAVGPFQTASDRYEVYMVFAKHAAQLDGTTSDIISRQLYDNWLATAAGEYNVEA